MLFKKKEEDLELIGLLGTLLICFPAMSKVTLDVKEKGMIMDFTLTEPPADTDDFDKKRKFIMDSLEFYNQLEKSTGGKCGVSYSNCAIHVFRDWDTLTSEEISLLVTLVRDKFSSTLQADFVPFIEAEDLYVRREAINPCILQLRRKSPKRNIVAIREDNRVMVY